MIPKWLKGIASEKDLDLIRDAVVAAEKKTSCEIVPMIVHRSITTGHVPVILFLLHALILWILLPYAVEFLPSVPYLALEIAAILIAAGLTWLQKDLDIWQRWLTRDDDQDASAVSRAQLEFYQSNIKATKNSTGVLIFVSWLEHEAVVLADKPVAEKFPTETWNEIVKKLISHVKAGDFSGGMIDAIETTGDLLAKEFPIRPGDHNELPDLLVIKE